MNASDVPLTLVLMETYTTLTDGKIQKRVPKWQGGLYNENSRFHRENEQVAG